MARQSLWTNADGLVVGFGPHTVDAVSAKPSTSGTVQQVTLKIKATELVDVGAPNALNLAQSVTIPAGSLVTSATLVVTEEFTTSASGTLDIGVYNASTGAVLDDDGIDAAIAAGSLTAGADIACDGDDIGVVASVPLKLYASYDTGAFTAGEATLFVEYIPAVG